MSTWRRKAIEAVPDLKTTLETVENPMQAWIEIRMYFEGLSLVGDKNQINDILNYARWCLSEEAGKLPNDTSTAVCCAFYEHLPEKPANWSFFKEWFSPNEFESLKGVFSYHIKEEELKNLSSVFYGKK
ncbi:hypothetical protein [Sedimenticola sp.]|uniref:hypothetical protein n=1 Tax=Sedimenticola sp. TaxID=1940285 RepID=UPI003D14126E